MCTSMRADLSRLTLSRGSAARRRIATGVVAAATVSGLALGSAPAFADTAPASPVGIGHATTDAQQRGTFSVPVWSDDPADAVASVTAVVRDGDTPVGAPITLVRSTDPSAPVELWTLPQDGVLKLTEDGGRMPHLGTYALDITATDAQGATVAKPDAGTLDFRLLPKFDGGIVLAPATVSYAHRQLTISGTLTGVQPGSGDLVPLPNRDVPIDENAWGDAPDLGTLHAATGVTGTFSTSVTLDDVHNFIARFAETSDEVDGSTSYGQVPNYTQTSLTVTGTADHARVLPGKTFKVSGVVRQGRAAKSSAPVIAGVPVTVALNCPGSSAGAVHTVSDATGHYAATLTGDPECYGSWSAYSSGTFTGGQTDASGQAALPDYSLVTGVSSTLAASGTVTVTGHLLRTYHRQSPYSGQNTFLWYSQNGKTGWARLKGANTDGNGAFRLVADGYIDGYYQVRHTDTDQLAASNGPIVRLNRIDTRIVSVKASRTKPKKNTVITVSGTLQQWTSGAWRAYGKQHVELYFQPKGKTTWQYKGSGTTAANGSTGFKPKATADGWWLIQYFGDAKHFNSSERAVYVDVV